MSNRMFSYSYCKNRAERFYDTYLQILSWLLFLWQYSHRAGLRLGAIDGFHLERLPLVGQAKNYFSFDNIRLR